jgi:putative transposase
MIGMNSPEMSLISVITSSPSIIVEKAPNIEPSKPLLRIKNIRLNPSKYLQQKIKQAINVTRYLYNMCVYLCCRTSPPCPFKQLPALLLNDDDNTNILEPEIRKYCAQVYYDIRAGAIRDFIKAFKTQLKLKQGNKNFHFEMKFRRKKTSTQDSIEIRSRDLKRYQTGEYACFPRKWEEEILTTFRENLPDVINHDCRLIMTKDNKFYLAIPTDIPTVPKILKYNAVSLDPGVNTFQTAYDTEGESYKIGNEDANEIDRLSKIAERMRQGVKRVWINGERRYRQARNKRERKGLLKAAIKLETKIKNKVSDLHRKTAKFLCEKYDTVIIPEFRASKMAEKREDGVWKRKISKETTRKMMRLGHYTFREILKAKGEVTGTNIVIGTEEWTSKTCGICMWVNKHLTGERILNCKNCGNSVDRDIGASRNIMMLNWERGGLSLRIL